MDFKAIVQKKVLGVPVLYLAGAAVLILAIIAYRTKQTVTPAVTDPNAVDATTPSGATDESAYGGLATQGTVVVQPVTPTPATVVVETNETWGQSAIQFLVDEHTPPGDAQQAIMLYLQGANLSYEQGALRDKAVGKLGIPPEPLETVGSVSAAPPQKQFGVFPGHHTVKGTGDNTASKIAALYYGNGDALHTNRIAEVNINLGPATGTYAVGSVVEVPGWTNPAYYTTTKTTNYSSGVAKASHVPGLTAERVLALNPTLTFPVKTGTKVRIV